MSAPALASLQEILKFRIAPIAADLDRADTAPQDVTVHVVVGDWCLELTATHYLKLPPPPAQTDTQTQPANAQTPANVPAQALPVRAPAEDPRFPPIAWNAVEAAGSEWVDSIELAAAAGHPYSGHWRSVVAALVRAGYLERDPRTKKLRRGPR